MTDSERISALEQTVDRLVDAFPKLTEALQKHAETIRAQREQIDKLGTAALAHQSSLEELGKVPDAVNSIAALVQQHQIVLQRLTGQTPQPAEVVN